MNELADRIDRALSQSRRLLHDADGNAFHTLGGWSRCLAYALDC